MSGVFGELNFGHSRADADSDEEEILDTKEDEGLKRKIYWLVDENELGKVNVDELIISDSPLACAYAHTYLLNHLRPEDIRLVALTATLSEFNVYQLNRDSILSNEKAKDVSLTKMRNNYIYLFNLNGVSYAICLLYNQLKSNELYDWINKLLVHVEFKSSLILTAQSRTYYFGTEEQFPLVKYVSSEKSDQIKDHPACSRLGEPNFLTNIAAAIINYCVLKNIPFLALSCYTPFLGIDLNSIKAIKRAIEVKLADKNYFIDNDLSKKALLSLERLETYSNNLYM